MAVSVLIVEDDHNISELLQMYLEKEGYTVAAAYDGGEGLAKFRTLKPDLVLLDVMMPVMDGWSVCKAIRAESQTPIIMLTAKGETNDKVSGLKSGADDYITKPFEMKEVLARIEAVLRREGAENLYAPQGNGAALLSCFLSQPGVHPQPASRRSLGLRLFRRFPDRGRTHQASAGKIGGCQRSVVPENCLGRGV